ncbi:MAG TPA: orotidine-5'-phosphate decarboxylase [Trebonia sp.]|jgi:orotidine-5'-phosphate decarboxylase|nr:orotidine-5'-phosphate decarboxylase [Trebonia sp.]
MTESFPARFARARARYGPLVLGADPHGPLLRRWQLTDDAEGLQRFTDIILKAADGAAGVIKPQSAFFERHGWQGIRALARLIDGARDMGILVILDVKRGDVGSTNEAYAQAYLGPKAPLAADAITVSPYLGLAAMDAFTDGAHDAGAGLFVVTRSSNPEGRLIQSAITNDGGSVEHRILAEIGELNARLAPGGIGPIGAVVGAGEMDPPLDLAGANALYLAPGIGAQGATPEDLARTFAACPDRVLPSASRSLLAAGPDPAAIRDAATSLNEEFRRLL